MVVMKADEKVVKKEGRMAEWKAGK